MCKRGSVGIPPTAFEREAEYLKDQDKTPKNPTARDAFADELSSVGDASDEELFLKDLFDAEDVPRECDVLREPADGGHTVHSSDANAGGARSTREGHESDDAELLSPDEIDAFFEGIRRGESEDSLPFILPSEEVFVEPSEPDASLPRGARIDAADSLRFAEILPSDGKPLGAARNVKDDAMRGGATDILSAERGSTAELSAVATEPSADGTEIHESAELPPLGTAKRKRAERKRARPRSPSREQTTVEQTNAPESADNAAQHGDACETELPQDSADVRTGAEDRTAARSGEPVTDVQTAATPSTAGHGKKAGNAKKRAESASAQPKPDDSSPTEPIEDVTSKSSAGDARNTKKRIASPSVAREHADSHAAFAAESKSDEAATELDRSLDSFTYEDTGSAFPRSSKKPDVFRLGMLVVCLFVFSYSVRFLVNNIYEKYKSDTVYNEINEGLDFSIPGSVAQDGIVSLLVPDSVGVATPTMDDIIKNGVSSGIASSSHAAELAKVRASLEHLKNINSDLYGYIVVPGTNISYPIAQHASDNDYYLDRAYNGEHLVNGSIFADVRCDDDVMMNYNTVLYGHNVTSGSMFNHVNMFFERDVFENTLIYLYTFDGIFVYKPFSIHETEYDSGYIKTAFETIEEFVSFANEMRELSDIDSDAAFTAESRMLTLSTCTNGIYSRRYALHAYLVERITD